MGINDAPGSKRINDPDKARVMAEAGKGDRDLAIRQRERVKTITNPDPRLIENALHAEQMADFEEDQAAHVYEEERRVKGI